eukprot:7388484-Prymnesium_polylepis.1
MQRSYARSPARSGGLGSEFNVCRPGSDCTDCGPRCPTPPIGPLPPSSPPTPPIGPPPPSSPPPPPLPPSLMYSFETSSWSESWATGTASTSHPWSHGSGATPSDSTGPSEAHTGSFYMFTEASPPRAQGDVFDLAYECNGAAAVSLIWWYHMHGDEIGTLRLKSADGNVVWTRTDNQGNSWQSASAVVPTSSFVFEGVRGTGWKGDIAMDDIAVSCLAFPPSPPFAPPLPPMPPMPPSIPHIVTHSFESPDLRAGWTTGVNSNSWLRQSGSTPSPDTGPSSAHEGEWYMFTESSSPRQMGDIFNLAYSCQADSRLGSSVRVDWFYHMRGSTIGSLILKSGTGKIIWRRDGELTWTWRDDATPPAFELCCVCSLRRSW